jgi:hypothetical protein
MFSSSDDGYRRIAASHQGGDFSTSSSPSDESSKLYATSAASLSASTAADALASSQLVSYLKKGVTF